MSTGQSSDSAEPPSEPEAPFTGDRRSSWLASHGRHPVTWAVAGLVLVGSAGVALLQQQPGVRARAQSVYCGLVTCAVLRSVAETSTAATGAPRPSSAALPSSAAPSHAPAPTPAPTPARSPAPKPVATSEPAPAPAPAPKPTAPPKPAPAPAPKPWPTWTPGAPRWPWPPNWPPRGPWGGGGGWHPRPGHGYQQPGGYQQQHW